MKKIISLLSLIFFVAACAPAPTPKTVVITVVVQPTKQLISNTLIPPTPIPPTPIPTATTVPCLNESTFGVLDMEKKQVCMQSAYYPCLRWDEITVEMKDTIICVRGVIQVIDSIQVKKTYMHHWDFADNRTGFFALSEYGGWHPVTGKSMAVGDCVVMTGTVQVLSNGRTYIFWGANSIYKAAVEGANTYYEHPDLWVIEGDTSFCQ